MGYSLADYIYEAREEKGISQRELARRTGIDNTEISRIEKGSRKKPGYKTLKKIVDELNLNIWDAMTLAGYEEEEMAEIYGLYYAENIDIIGYDKIDKAYYIDSNGEDSLDLITALESYKSGDLNLQQIVGILSVIIHRDTIEFIHPEQRKKYNLESLIYNKDEKKD